MDNITYINAGAGSGKTYTLTHHLSKALVEDGIKPSEIILTTFTDAAASEFREKARAVLLKEGKTELAAEMGSAAIGTVHSVYVDYGVAMVVLSLVETIRKTECNTLVLTHNNRAIFPLVTVSCR